MSTRRARQRRWTRYWLREDKAGRTARRGYGDRDTQHLLRKAETLKEQDPATWDDLDRHIVESFG